MMGIIRNLVCRQKNQMEEKGSVQVRILDEKELIQIKHKNTKFMRNYILF